MSDTIFEFLFKYPRIAYESGDVVLGAPWSPAALALLIGAGAILVAVGYRRGGSGRWGLAGIRIAGIVIVGICLLRPMLVLSTAVPRQNMVAVIVDDSRSMEIADEAGERTRGDAARRAFADPESRVLQELDERFLVRHYRFSARTDRLRDPSELGFHGTRSRLGASLEHVRRELSSLPLSGIVLVTDGGDQEPGELEDAILGLRAEGIPVHTVGTGRERLEPDVLLERVEMPTSVIRGSTVVADVVVAHEGLGGRTVPVQVLEEGRILATRDVELPRRGGSATVRIPLTLEGTGVRNLRVAVPVQQGELVEENNHRDVHVRIREEPEKILYFEGEPRSEVAFMRRALRDDDDLRMVVLQRSGDDRFLRFVEEADELIDGFPRTRDELFEYRGLILGSVEASFFSQDQLRMIADFVDRRGGGLLVLGGWRALAEGGYAGTALGPLIPAELEGVPQRLSDEERAVELFVAPTERGRSHPVVLLGGEDPDQGGAEGGVRGQGTRPRGVPGDEGLDGDSRLAYRGRGDDAAARWQSLPPLTSVNRLGPARAGATVVLSGQDIYAPGDEVPVFAYQRYGAGLSAMLAVQDTWLWQMHADIPLEDRTHEIFWRQLLRWLVQDVPESLKLTAVRDRVAPEEPVELVVGVRDPSYLPVNDARVTALITDPFGAEREMPLAWSVDRDGEYRGSFVPEAAGPYEIRVRAGDGEDANLSPPLHVEAGVLDRELGSGAMRGDLLRRIAEETGGRFYTLDDIASLPEDVRYTERGTVVQEERDLWDIPLFFFLLTGLLCGEWLLRRRRGLA